MRPTIEELATNLSDHAKSRAQIKHKDTTRERKDEHGHHVHQRRLKPQCQETAPSKHDKHLHPMRNVKAQRPPTAAVHNHGETRPTTPRPKKNPSHTRLLPSPDSLPHCNGFQEAPRNDLVRVGHHGGNVEVVQHAHGWGSTSCQSRWNIGLPTTNDDQNFR